MVAYFLRQMVAEYGVFLMNEMVKQLGKQVLQKLIREKGKDFIQGVIFDYGFQATLNYAFDDMPFPEAANPSNINFLSLGVSGLENMISYNSKWLTYGISLPLACFVNGWSDESGFKEDFDFETCAIGIVGTGLSKQVPLLFKYTKKFAKYSTVRLKKGLARLNISGRQADEVIKTIKKSADDAIETNWFSKLPKALRHDIDAYSEIRGLFEQTKSQIEIDELRNAWQALISKPTLRIEPENLKIVRAVKSRFSYMEKSGQEALEAIFSGHRSVQKFLNNLKKAEELFEGVGIKHWSGIKSSPEVRLTNDAGDIVGKIENGVFKITNPQGSRPDAETYLTREYIAEHLAKFDDGVVRFTTQSKINKFKTLGNDEAFAMPKKEYDQLFEETLGDLSQIERKLGLNPGDLSGDDAVVAWVKKQNLSEIKIPTGNEDGVIDEFWILGGKTSGGVTEGIVNLSNPNLPYTKL